ncbi:hypothetical protein [Fodinibius sediminis]|uniref:Outer membrane protein beta-barrel domain-containing protein n=1 Tax=Fodinibius sediminis TaxID=1214077 RepID=A0A521E6M7_9BACT|nr:hypothetical protein [Fodinibius sediminis]SMO79061.1 hypothetical protein SAMN06265218_11376 [Fodinibius sediminis]
MKTATKTLLLIAAILMGTTTAFAQDRPDSGTVGLSASLQSSQTNIKIPIWASESIVIAPVVGFTHEEDDFTTLNVGINPRFYQSLGDDFATYIGAQGILQHTSFDEPVDDDDSDFLIGASGGGEYFLDEHFSLGVEGQLNFLIDDNNDDSIFTAAAITGTFYF